MQYSDDLLSNWKSLDRVLPFIQDPWQRPLVIEVLTDNDPIFKSMPFGCCNVAQKGLGCTSEEGCFADSETGCALELQAIYVGQAVTIDIMSKAILEIQTRELDTYTFACSNATHRSVGCAILLAMIGYPKAEICLKTQQTTREVLKCGLLLAE